MVEIKNSTEILEAYRKKDECFQLIKDLATSISEIQQEKHKTAGEIRDIYAVIMKNLSTTKKMIGQERVVEEGSSGYGGKDNPRVDEFYVNTEGISYNYYYKSWSGGSDRSQYIHKDNFNLAQFFSHLIEIKKTLFEDLISVLKENKADIVKKFLEKIELVDLDDTHQKELEKPKPIVVKEHLYNRGDYNNDTDKEDNDYTFTHFYSNSPSNINLTIMNEDGKLDRGYNTPNISTISLSLNDRLKLEQVIEEVKLYYEEYKAKEIQKLNNIRLLLEDVRVKFAPYLMLLELKKGNK